MTVPSHSPHDRSFLYPRFNIGEYANCVIGQNLLKTYSQWLERRLSSPYSRQNRSGHDHSVLFIDKIHCSNERKIAKPESLLRGILADESFTWVLADITGPTVADDKPCTITKDHNTIKSYCKGPFFVCVHHVRSLSSLPRLIQRGLAPNTMRIGSRTTSWPNHVESR